MKSIRNPKHLERYEDVVFDLEQPLNIAPANNTVQVRNNLKFIADNSGEATPFDWYNARIAMDFKVEQHDGTDFAIGANVNDDSLTANRLVQIIAYEADQMGIVNGANSFISRLSVLANGKELYQCNYANHSVNIKNLLEYNKSYADSVATNEFYFLDTSTSANKNRFTRRNVTHRQDGANPGGDQAGLMLDNTPATFNEGFAKRKALLGTSSTVHCEIPLNRYSFFEALEDKLLPNTKIEINFEIEKDDNLIWRTGGNRCRVVITHLQLFVPRIIYNKDGHDIYMSNYLKPDTWTYLNEVVESNLATNQAVGNFRITNGISKPRHVFVFFINTPNIESQTANPFLYNTFSVSTDPRTLNRCYLEVGNGNEYPDIHYKPSEDPSRVFRDVMKYVFANNDFQGGTLLNRQNFENIFPFVYFDLTKQKIDIKDGVTKLAFHYELSGATAANYNIYALVLHDREAVIEQQSGKLLLRA